MKGRVVSLRRWGDMGCGQSSIVMIMISEGEGGGGGDDGGSMRERSESKIEEER